MARHGGVWYRSRAVAGLSPKHPPLASAKPRPMLEGGVFHSGFKLPGEDREMRVWVPHPAQEPLIIGKRAVAPDPNAVLEAVINRLREAPPSVIRMTVCDLSAAPYLDLAGSRMLRELGRMRRADRTSISSLLSQTSASKAPRCSER